MCAGGLVLLVLISAEAVEVEGVCLGLLGQELERGRAMYYRQYWADVYLRRHLRSGVTVQVDLLAEGQEAMPTVRLRGLTMVIPLRSIGTVSAGTVEARWGRGAYYPNLWLDSALWDRGLVLDVRVWGAAAEGRFRGGAWELVVGASENGNEAFSARAVCGPAWAGVAFETRDHERRSRGWVVGGGLEVRWLRFLAGYRRYTVSPFPGWHDRAVVLLELFASRPTGIGAVLACLVSAEDGWEDHAEGVAEVNAQLLPSLRGKARVKAWVPENRDPLWIAAEPVVRWEPANGVWLEVGEEVGLPTRGPTTYTLRFQTGWLF
jgi:hypothetical protein